MLRRFAKIATLALGPIQKSGRKSGK